MINYIHSLIGGSKLWPLNVRFGSNAAAFKCDLTGTFGAKLIGIFFNLERSQSWQGRHLVRSKL